MNTPRKESAKNAGLWLVAIGGPLLLAEGGIGALVYLNSGQEDPHSASSKEARQLSVEELAIIAADNEKEKRGTREREEARRKAAATHPSSDVTEQGRGEQD